VEDLQWSRSCDLGVSRESLSCLHQKSRDEQTWRPADIFRTESRKEVGVGWRSWLRILPAFRADIECNMKIRAYTGDTYLSYSMPNRHGMERMQQIRRPLTRDDSHWSTKRRWTRPLYLDPSPIA